MNEKAVGRWIYIQPAISARNVRKEPLAYIYFISGNPVIIEQVDEIYLQIISESTVALLWLISFYFHAM